MSAPVMPLAGGQVAILLVQLAALLLLGLSLGRLAARFGLPAIVGELMAGVLLGPSLLGHAAPAIHDWLLPADAGADAPAGRGRPGRRAAAGRDGRHRAGHPDHPPTRHAALRISVGGLLIPIGFGILIGYLAPAVLVPDTTERPVFALFLAVAMCVTAIPVIAKTLADMKLHPPRRRPADHDLRHGRRRRGLVPAVDRVGHGDRRRARGQVALSLLLLVAFVVAAIFVGRPLVRGAIRLAGRSAETGPTIVTAVVIVLVGAAITQSMHMEAVFGAFIAGILIGQAVRERRAMLAPLRTIVLTVLAPIFLASAGPADGPRRAARRPTSRWPPSWCSRWRSSASSRAPTSVRDPVGSATGSPWPSAPA